jgi:hypothetical protein
VEALHVVAWMRRSVIQGRYSGWFPDYVTLHPGYSGLTLFAV